MRVALALDTPFLIIFCIGLIFITIIDHQHFVTKNLIVGLNPIIITVD